MEYSNLLKIHVGPACEKKAKIFEIYAVHLTLKIPARSLTRLDAPTNLDSSSKNMLTGNTATLLARISKPCDMLSVLFRCEVELMGKTEQDFETIVPAVLEGQAF